MDRRSERRRGPSSGVCWLACALALGSLAPARAARAGELLEVRLGSLPHPPGGAPDVIVHVPSGFDAAAPLDVVVFLHGFSSCVRALVSSAPVRCARGGPVAPGHGLAALHERARTNTLLIVPQLAFLARRADAPRFERPGGFDAMLDELLRRPLRAVTGRALAAGGVRSVTLVAHSGGYRAGAAILDDPKRRSNVNRLVLLDALYARWDVFARWFRQDRKRSLVSLYTSDAKTTLGNRRLAAAIGIRFAHDPAPLDRQLRRKAPVIERVRTPHARLPERHLEDVLRALFATAR